MGPDFLLSQVIVCFLAKASSYIEKRKTKNNTKQNKENKTEVQVVWLLDGILWIKLTLVLYTKYLPSEDYVTQSSTQKKHLHLFSTVRKNQQNFLRQNLYIVSICLQI